jgi:hypothetical protein
MTVYIVFDSHDIVRVFSTRKAAMDFIKRVPVVAGAAHTIEAWEVEEGD